MNDAGFFTIMAGSTGVVFAGVYVYYLVLKRKVQRRMYKHLKDNYSEYL
ncbi:MAG: DUF4233 domain-containing protein [Bacteroidetes bacterium]|nr:DUF4233 domain-containing protein [Bacteroidota bacterium]MBU1718660.1 DUF4233 domain-containing protein [Bacteroidota bacterium]